MRDAAFDRTLFGLDTKILLPYLSMQYNHNARDKLRVANPSPSPTRTARQQLTFSEKAT